VSLEGERVRPGTEAGALAFVFVFETGYSAGRSIPQFLWGQA
jgi:hypothetical protein